MNFKLPLFLCVTISLCLCANLLKAQNSDAQYFVPSVYPKSPNVASFAKYGDYQVNLYTGLPDISIPLYTVEAGGLKVPITLSYHASGIKVTDVASWVGLGWSIPGGGAVSRRVMGGPDDGGYGYLAGYLRQYGTLSMTVDADMDYVDNIANGLYDGRPDIYSFDFPGHSGKFFFNGTNAYKPTLIPMAPVKINYTYVAPSGSTIKKLTNFTIADEHGNNFKFGDASVETTSTSGGGNASSTPAASSWLLENMISQNRRDTISFTYGSEYLTYPDATSQLEALTDGIGSIASGTNPYSVSDKPGPTTSIASGVAGKPLSQINFKNGMVVFEKDDSLRKDINLGGAANNVYGLKNIKVYAYNYNTRLMEVQKTIRFYKTYFGTTAANNFRLRLDSIQVLDAAGGIIQHYRFTYNTSIVLPYYGSYARDYWGYYNGKTSSTSLIPQMTVSLNGSPVTIGGSVAHNRDCDSNYMQAYVLKSISYPTGGHTDFTFQPNQYYNNLGALRIAGGLRIASIKSYDGVNSTPIVKTYQYNTADSNFFLQYSFFAGPPQTHRYYSPYGQSGAPTEAYYCTVRNYVSNPNIDLEPFDAAPVVYHNVTEYNGTPGSNVGRTDYIYTYMPDDTQDASAAVGTPVVTTYYYNRGKLLSKTESIHKSDGSYQVVNKESNTYAAFPEKQYIGVGFVARKLNTNEGSAGNTPIHYGTAVQPTDVNSYTFANYWIYSHDNYLTSTTAQIYDTNDASKFTTSTVNYIYGDTTHQQIAKTIHVDSKGNTHVTVNKYPFNYLSGTTTNNAVLDTMINRHMDGEVVEKWDSVKNVTTSVNAIAGAQLNQYQYGSITGTIVPYKISTLSVNSPITNFTPASVVSGNLSVDSRYVQMISFDQYDGQNNLMHYTPRNANPSAIMWDHLQELPVAQVKNAPVNFTAGNMAYTSFEADSKGNWNYSGTPVTDQTAPTGSKVYPLSSGSITMSFYNSIKANTLSYWSNNGVATVFCASNITGTPLGTANGWTYYEHTIPQGSSSTITISGAASVDELRLYPVDAQMITYAYAPAGLTAIADTKGGISHFEYDYFQRLKNVKDWYGNIVNNYGYHTYDQTIPNDAMSNTFTRNNCPSGTTPQSTTYSVAANKYLSSTKASANAEASYDLNTNGQIKANTVCGCPVITVSFTLTNSSGISGWQASFTGGSNPTYPFPTSGSTVVQVPAGTYSSVYVGPVGSATHTFTMGSRPPVTGAHSATFNNVLIATSGSTDTSLTVQ